MALCSGSKNKVAFYIVLVSLLIKSCHQTEVNDLSSKSRDFGSSKSTEEMKTVDKLSHIRQLGRSLFSAWNFGGESEIEGRTFGRIRVMRQIMLPMAFLGGFLTAVIIAIKKISILNMLLISGVLMLNLAFMFGKIMVSKALWLHQGKFQSQQQHHHDHWQHSLGSHPSSYGSSFLDRADDSPYAQQPAFTSQFSGQNYNQLPSYFTSPQQYPTTFGNQPLALQPQSILPVYNRLQKQFVSNDLQQPKSSMSPAEMDKLLTDTLARISNTRLSSPLVRQKRKSSVPEYSSRRYINLLRPFS